MGQARQTVERVTSALEAHDVQKARQWITDDFTFNDPTTPQPPMGADQWVGMQQALFKAFPDMSFNFDILREEGNQVWVSANITGTHTGEFDLSAQGMGVVPATGKYVSAGKSVTRGSINDDGKIEKIEVVEQEGGGVPGMLQQIGVNLGQ